MEKQQIKNTLIFLGAILVILLIGMPSLVKQDTTKGSYYDFEVGSEAEVLCSNPGKEAVKLELTLLGKKEVNEFKELSVDGIFQDRLKDIFPEVNGFENGVLNISSNADVICNVYEAEKSDNRDGIKGESFFQVKQTTLGNMSSKLVLNNLSASESKFLVNVYTKDANEEFEYTVEPYGVFDTFLDLQDDSIVSVAPSKDDVIYNAELILGEKTVYPTAGYSSSDAIAFGDSVIVSNLLADDVKVDYIINNRIDSTFNFEPYSSRIFSRDDNTFISFKANNNAKIAVSVLTDNAFIPVSDAKEVLKNQVINFSAKEGKTNKVIIQNNSVSDESVNIYTYTKEDKILKELSVKKFNTEEYTIKAEDDGYVLISANNGVKAYLGVYKDNKLSYFSAGKEVLITEEKVETDFTKDTAFTRSNGDDDKAKTFMIAKALGNTADGDDEEDDDEEVEVISPELLACTAQECLDTYDKETKRGYGIKYINYVPSQLGKTPKYAPIYIHNHSSKSVKFDVIEYKIDGTEAISQKSLLVKANENKKTSRAFGAAVQSLIVIKPSDVSAEYSAYVIAYNASLGENSWHRQIQPSDLITKKSVLFDAKGKLSVANVTDVPVLAHYEILTKSDESAQYELKYSGDQWFLPKAQRLIDIATQLNEYDEALMKLTVRKYFVPQSCKSETNCSDLSVALIADLYKDGVVYPVRDETNAAGKELMGYFSSNDTYLELQNESPLVSEVNVRYARGLFGENYAYYLLPYERKTVYLPGLVVENPENQLYEIRNIAGNIQISSEQNTSAIMRTGFNTEANVARYVSAIDKYENTPEVVRQEGAEYQELDINCFPASGDGSDKDGLCTVIETKLGSSSIKSDSDKDCWTDSSEVYEFLLDPTVKDYPYGENCSDNTIEPRRYQDDPATISVDKSEGSLMSRLEALYFKTDSYRAVTSSEEIENAYIDPDSIPEPEKKPDVKKLSCRWNSDAQSSECKESYDEFSPKLTGESYIMYNPNLVQMPETNPPYTIHIVNHSDKIRDFTLQYATVKGDVNTIVRTVRAQANGVINQKELWSTGAYRDVRTFIIKPKLADDTEPYAAYLIVRDKSETEPWYYSIPAVQPLHNKTASFNANGKLVVGNISDVPTMIHYQIISGGRLIFAGDQWFLARTQRTIDVGEQLAEEKARREAEGETLDLENTVMNFTIKKYFLPCTDNSCANDGQLIANMYLDGTVFPVESASKVVSSESIAKLESYDSYVDLINETATNNEVVMSLNTGGLDTDYAVTLSPNEVKHVYLGDFVYEENPEEHLDELQETTGYITLKSERMLSASIKQKLSTGAVLTGYPSTYGEYKKISQLTESEGGFGELKIYCSDYGTRDTNDTDKDGVCTAIETLLGMGANNAHSNMRKDAEGNDVLDGEALYKYLYLMTTAENNQPLRSYQDLIDSGDTSSIGSGSSSSTTSLALTVQTADKNGSKLFKNKANSIGVNSTSEDQEEAGSCTPVPVGVQCGGQCCVGTCSGAGREGCENQAGDAIEPQCCGKGETAYLDFETETYKCCYGTTMINQGAVVELSCPKNENTPSEGEENTVQSQSSNEQERETFTETKVETCCGWSGAGYTVSAPRGLSTSLSNSCSNLSMEKQDRWGVNCCNADKLSCVLDGQTSVCCPNNNCVGSAKHASYRVETEKGIENKPLEMKGLCCAEGEYANYSYENGTLTANCCPEEKQDKEHPTSVKAKLTFKFWALENYPCILSGESDCLGEMKKDDVYKEWEEDYLVNDTDWDVITAYPCGCHCTGANEQQCGEDCCNATSEKCINNESCCLLNNVCGSECCSTDEVCKNSHCEKKNTECGEGQFGCGIDLCCTSGTQTCYLTRVGTTDTISECRDLCNGQTCESGQKCVDGKCVDVNECCDGAECYGAGCCDAVNCDDPEKCTDGSVPVNGTCSNGCPLGQWNCGGECSSSPCNSCPPGHVKVPGIGCKCQGANCNCAAGTRKCPNGLCIPEDSPCPTGTDDPEPEEPCPPEDKIKKHENPSVVLCCGNGSMNPPHKALYPGKSDEGGCCADEGNIWWAGGCCTEAKKSWTTQGATEIEKCCNPDKLCGSKPLCCGSEQSCNGNKCQCPEEKRSCGTGCCASNELCANPETGFCKSCPEGSQACDDSSACYNPNTQECPCSDGSCSVRCKEDGLTACGINCCEGECSEDGTACKTDNPQNPDNPDCSGEKSESCGGVCYNPNTHECDENNNVKCKEGIACGEENCCKGGKTCNNGTCGSCPSGSKACGDDCYDETTQTCNCDSNNNCTVTCMNNAVRCAIACCSAGYACEVVPDGNGNESEQCVCEGNECGEGDNKVCCGDRECKSDGTCEDCPEGSYDFNGTCKKCPEGFVKSSEDLGNLNYFGGTVACCPESGQIAFGDSEIRCCPGNTTSLGISGVQTPQCLYPGGDEPSVEGRLPFVEGAGSN